MPPTQKNTTTRKVMTAMAAPANKVSAVASQQQGGQSGVIPTSDNPSRQATNTGTLFPYGPGADTWLTQGVGTEVLDNSGNPMFRFGNLLVQKDSGTYFEDGGFIFLDSSGNGVAGYSEETGLFGFGGGGLTVTESIAVGSAFQGGDTQSVEFSSFYTNPIGLTLDGSGNLVFPVVADVLYNITVLLNLPSQFFLPATASTDIITATVAIIQPALGAVAQTVYTLTYESIGSGGPPFSTSSALSPFLLSADPTVFVQVNTFDLTSNTSQFADYTQPIAVYALVQQMS